MSNFSDLIMNFIKKNFSISLRQYPEATSKQTFEIYLLVRRYLLLFLLRTNSHIDSSPDKPIHPLLPPHSLTHSLLATHSFLRRFIIGKS